MELYSGFIPLSPFAFACYMLIGMLGFFELGRRIGRRHKAMGGLVNAGATDGAVFALYGLLLAFTFSGAPARLAARQQLVADESNAIGTAYLRTELLGNSSQPAVRRLFRDYLDERLAGYAALPNLEEAKVHLTRSASVQQEIWTTSVAASYQPDARPDAAKLLLPALNTMIDITSTRTMAGLIHPPPVIFALLFVLALVCAALAGYGMACDAFRSWLHILSFVVIAVATVYIILEIEYPRMGLIPIGKYDQMLVDLRRSMQ